MYDATVSLQTGFEQQRRLAPGFQSENRKSYLPVAVAGGHLRRRSLLLFGLTSGTRLAPVQFELHGSYQVSKSGLLQDFSLSKKNAYPICRVQIVKNLIYRLVVFTIVFHSIRSINIDEEIRNEE